MSHRPLPPILSPNLSIFFLILALPSHKVVDSPSWFQLVKLSSFRFLILLSNKLHYYFVNRKSNKKWCTLYPKTSYLKSLKRSGQTWSQHWKKKDWFSSVDYRKDLVWQPAFRIKLETSKFTPQFTPLKGAYVSLLNKKKDPGRVEKPAKPKRSSEHRSGPHLWHLIWLSTCWKDPFPAATSWLSWSSCHCVLPSLVISIKHL